MMDLHMAGITYISKAAYGGALQAKAPASAPVLNAAYSRCTCMEGSCAGCRLSDLFTSNIACSPLRPLGKVFDIQPKRR